MLRRFFTDGLENVNKILEWCHADIVIREHTRRVAAAVLVCAALVMVGCTDDSGTNPIPLNLSATLQKFQIDQNGGTAVYSSTVKDVIVTLTIPAGALDTSTEITIDHAQTFPVSTGLVTDAVFEFGPDALVFNIPVDLEINYTDSLIAGVQEGNLRVHKADSDNWIPLLGSVDTDNKTVSTTLDGFSIYGLKAIPDNGTDSGTDPGTDTGTGGTDPGTDPGSDPGAGGGADTWSTIQSDILQPHCVFCHGGLSPMAGLSWEADQYDTIVTNGYMSSTSMLEINPGDSANSYLIWKLNGEGPAGEAIAGSRMPLSGPPYLDQTVINRIAAWIDAGAPASADPGPNPDPGSDPGPDPVPDPDPDPDPAPDPSSIVPTWYGVQANIFGKFCTMCHSGATPSAGLSWEVDQYDTIVTNGYFSTEITTMLEVAPGDPNASYMYWKITNNPGIIGSFMPATGVPLDQALIDVIEQWILDGAPLGDPADADAGGPTGPTFPVGSWMYVWSETLQVCTICHSQTPSSDRCGVDFDCPPKDVILTSDNYFGVVDGDEVDPGFPDSSKLWERVTDPDPDKRMPFEMPALTQDQLDIIQAWILDGAPFCPAGEVCP